MPEGGRVEFRLPDGAANPYLLQAAILAAGSDGIAQGLDPGEPSSLNMILEGHRVPRGTRRLPLNLLDAVRLFSQSKLYRRMLGDELVDGYAKLRMKDWNDHARHLSAWERANTLDC